MPRINLEPYKFYDLAKRIKRSRSGQPAIRGKNLRAQLVALGRINTISFYYYDTCIGTVSHLPSNGGVVVSVYHGGYKTYQTKHYMNEILAAYGCTYRIVQRDYVWYWRDLFSGITDLFPEHGFTCGGERITVPGQ